MSIRPNIQFLLAVAFFLLGCQLIGDNPDTEANLANDTQLLVSQKRKGFATAQSDLPGNFYEVQVKKKDGLSPFQRTAFSSLSRILRNSMRSCFYKRQATFSTIPNSRHSKTISKLVAVTWGSILHQTLNMIGPGTAG